jgi:MoaA/NifB/PqqE/SkfB family radical SAM enzyme
MLDTPERKEKFDEVFGEIGDELYVDALMPINGLEDDTQGNYQFNKFMENKADVQCCSRPFFQLIIDYDGTALACCTSHSPIKLGDIKVSKLSDVWGKGVHRELLTAILQHASNKYQCCNGCTFYQYTTAPEDKLDGYEAEILSRMEAQNG